MKYIKCQMQEINISKTKVKYQFGLYKHEAIRTMMHGKATNIYNNKTSDLICLNVKILHFTVKYIGFFFNIRKTNNAI
jgi:hypothetical protein